MYLFWKDLNPKLRTVRVLSKPDLKFFPKRWEEREVPVPVELAELLERIPYRLTARSCFRHRTGNREQNFLRRCKLIAERAGLDPEEFDLKTFRSTYATSMLRRGFDVRTVQHWMGHKSLETTMRYLAPAPDVHDRLDLIRVPGAATNTVPKKPPRARHDVTPRNGTRRRDTPPNLKVGSIMQSTAQGKRENSQ
jgi:integrase